MENQQKNNLVPAEEVDIIEADGSQKLTEEEIDDFTMKEQIAASKGNNVDIDSKYTSQLGMQFQTKDQAQHFFNFYAYLAGFETTVAHVFRTSSRKRNNEVTKVAIKCNKFGKDEQPKTADQQEAATDKDIGKKVQKDKQMSQ